MDKRILLVEDNATHRTMTQDFLWSRGYRVLGLPDGLSLFQTIAEFRPNLLLLDLKLPEVNGFVLLEQLQASEWRSLPVIIVSAYAFQKEKQRALSLGARSYLTKPVQFDYLLQAIEAELN